MQQNNIDYQQLILRHLDRISRLSVYITGQRTLNEGGGSVAVISTEDDKKISLAWSITLLRSIIPDQIIDETFKKAYNPRDFMQFPDNFKLLNGMVNLLNRNALLLTKTSEAGSIDFEPEENFQ